MRDPVAQSVQNQLNRDAAPHPDEVEPPQCDECGEQTESPKMIERPECPALQHPEPEILCPECHSQQKSWKEQQLEGVEDQIGVAGVVHFDCGNFELIEYPVIKSKKQTGWSEDGNTIWEEHEVADTREQPTAPLECRCGSRPDDMEWF